MSADLVARPVRLSPGEITYINKKIQAWLEAPCFLSDTHDEWHEMNGEPKE